jgi:transketolase
MLNSALRLNRNLFKSTEGGEATRDSFGKWVENTATNNPNIVVLTADLNESVRTNKFAEKHPKRFIECGIAEQNMASMAAGLALSGKIPFITSHAVFSPSYNWAQIRQSICLSNANVKIIGSHQGFSNGDDGGNATPLEDVALMRVLPNMIVLNPIDGFQTVAALDSAAKHKGPVYIRLSKARTPEITTTETSFELGKAQVLVEGQDVTLISTGPLTAETLFAARKLLHEHNISAEVVAVPTIKPLDGRTIATSAKKTSGVIVVEEHQINGGLGEAVARALGEMQPTRMLSLGMQDCFGESGKYKELLVKYGLDAASIAEKVLEFIK